MDPVRHQIKRKKYLQNLKVIWTVKYLYINIYLQYKFITMRTNKSKNEKQMNEWPKYKIGRVKSVWFVTLSVTFREDKYHEDPA